MKLWIILTSILMMHTILDKTNGDNCLDGLRCCTSADGDENCPTSCDSCGYCNSTTRECMSGCKEGYYGELCNMTCSELCALGENETAVCRQYDGSCIDCRSKTYHGDNCNETCSDSCFNGTCNIKGLCIGGCKDGFYGELCKPCGKNCNNSLCSPDNDLMYRCTEGCIKGYTRPDCKLICPENCHICLQNGSCIQCMKDYVSEINKKDNINRCKLPGLSVAEIIVIVTDAVMAPSLLLFFLVRCLLERRKEKKERKNKKKKQHI